VAEPADPINQASESFDGRTEPIQRRRTPSVRGFRLTVVAGPDKGKTLDSRSGRCAIGTHPANELTLTDPTVSRFHCELLVDDEGARLRDLASSNGAIVDGVRVVDAFLGDACTITLGRTQARFEFLAERFARSLSEQECFGDLVGSSAPMRQAFALLERAAQSDVAVLLEGESGTGKEVAAESLHQAGPRANKPFVVVDCGAIPRELLESELFGHERGAFTGAVTRRTGAFEEADGGTLFLDEVGELPLDMQPKLLRALDKGEVRRVGQNAYRTVDVRVVAATNRDLRADVNAGRFRTDLYYRLAVVKITLPPLRERTDDLPMLADHLLGRLGVSAEAREGLLQPDFLAALRHGAWTGNVRELRNYLERCLVFREPLPLPSEHVPEESLSYDDARERAIAEFERRFAERLLARHDGKVATAAAAARMNRAYLYRILRRHGIKA
jgi:DNA-binding NtrC family response regulator